MIRFDDVVRMKLLQKLPDNHLLLTTINKKYHPVEINEDSVDQIKVLGRIVWVGTPL
ncbi:S24 family peptidase [Aliifodinibius salipaludis]|uniref:S24 family peptidase n=1 Tax=Fodinibius salipaludis TaxID=2032627 RepID=UPI0033136255